MCAQQDGASPLFCAMQEGHRDVVELLIDRDANVNIQVSAYSQTFCYAIALYSYVCHSSISLFGRSPQPKFKGPTPLYIGAQEGYKSLVSKLIKHKANLHTQTRVRACDSVMTTKVVVTNNIILLFAIGAENLSQYSHVPSCVLVVQGITPLFIACQERHVGVTRALLNGKVDPNTRNKVNVRVTVSLTTVFSRSNRSRRELSWTQHYQALLKRHGGGVLTSIFFTERRIAISRGHVEEPLAHRACAHRGR